MSVDRRHAHVMTREACRQCLHKSEQSAYVKAVRIWLSLVCMQCETGQEGTRSLSEEQSIGKFAEVTCATGLCW